MEDNWVETADWPFIALSTTSTSVVVPFDEPGQKRDHAKTRSLINIITTMLIHKIPSMFTLE